MESYLLHITFVNFKEKWRREHIVTDRTISAYLTVQFDSQEYPGIMELKADQNMKSFIV